MDRTTELSRLTSSASAEGSTKLESFTLLEGGSGAAEASGRGLSLHRQPSSQAGDTLQESNPALLNRSQHLSRALGRSRVNRQSGGQRLPVLLRDEGDFAYRGGAAEGIEDTLLQWGVNPGLFKKLI